MIRTTITESIDNVLTINSIANQLVATNKTLSDLDSAPFFIIGFYQPWKPDRLPAWPNPSFDYGTVISGTATMLVSSNNHDWETNEHVGRDILYNSSGSVLNRVAITANTNNTLTFANANAPSAGSSFIIIVSGQPGYLDKISGPQNLWENSKNENSWGTILPNGTLSNAYFPELVIHYTSDNGVGGCQSNSIDGPDSDVWTAASGSGCDRINDNLTPGLYRGLRGLQAYLQNSLSGNFLDPTVSYSGLTNGTTTPPNIHNMSIAEFFIAAGINSITLPYQA